MPTFVDEDELPAGKAAGTAQPVIASDDLDVDWGDADAMASEGLDRIQPADKTSKVRAAVLTDICPVKKAWVHFVNKSDGTKTMIRCHTKRVKNKIVGEPAACCKKLNHDDSQKAQLMFAALGVKYQNADPQTGGYADGNTPSKVALGWLKLSKSGYKQISELVLEGERAENFDFTIAYKDNGIGYDYKRKSKGAPRFRQDPEVLAQILEEAKPFANGEFLVARLGKVLSETDLKALLSGQPAAANKAAQIDSTDDL